MSRLLERFSRVLIILVFSVVGIASMAGT